MRKICVVTGTRAEYGLLSRLMRLIASSGHTQLQTVVTNMHLSPLYGNTYQEIEADGFTIDWRVPILDDGTDNAVATLKSMSKALSGFADAYAALQPDLVVLLGDRYEILAAATAALIERIPIAHIHGGEVTEGAYDDAIRHSITKMSHLHFTSTEQYRQRVIQMGEQPGTVFHVGALGVENIRELPLMTKEEIEHEVQMPLDGHTLLITYHPVTLGNRTAEHEIGEFLAALQERQDLRCLFTMPNSDTGSRVIADAITTFVQQNSERARAFTSLGIRRYLSAMKYAGAVVGNSSSGVLETPSFGIPTLNIGDRQKGRIMADSIVCCDTDKDAILRGLDIVASPAFRQAAAKVHNPYEKEGTAKAIFDVISTHELDTLIPKHFHDL
jgi:UDP-N-acetylglucosamine 2-epimerase (non-hydrolysing)/GDP/UDP-N,N'-diacetylbacillosamine 2-epimerase (hydrolysing)